MAEQPQGPDSLAGMAFQLLLQKMTNLELAMQAIPPLLKKIVDQLEAQHTQPEVPVASYAELYPEWQEEPETPELPGPPAPLAPPAPVEASAARRRWWHWFLRGT